MNKPIISLIAAIGKNRELGLRNKLLWDIPEDMAHFKSVTLGHAVIMGQKTFESIGHALHGRTNIVLSRDPNFIADKCIVVDSIERALHEARQVEKEEIFFIGGASVYEQALGLADKLYLTLIHDEREADVYFPDYSTFIDRKKTGSGISSGIKFEFWEIKK